MLFVSTSISTKVQSIYERKLAHRMYNLGKDITQWISNDTAAWSEKEGSGTGRQSDTLVFPAWKARSMANFFLVNLQVYVGSPLLAHWASLLVIHSSMSSPSWLGIMSSLASHMDECALKSPAIIWFGPRLRQAVSVSAENAGRPGGRVESGGL